MKLEVVVRQFENNNEEYVKIRKTAEEKTVSILSYAKPLLRIALLSLTESIRKDPDRYSSLIYQNNTSSSTEYNNQNYETASYGQQQQQQYLSQAYTDMLLEEVEKLYNKLVKRFVDETIRDYASNIQPSLPLLATSNEEQQQNRTFQKPDSG